MKWELAPSLVTEPYAFASLGGHHPAYYTPTPGGTNTIYHPQAGDLHTPSLAMTALGTPLSLPTSGAIHPGIGQIPSQLHVQAPGPAPGMLDMSHFQTTMAPQLFQPFNLGAFQPQAHQQPPEPQSFAPSSLMHQDTGYETMDHEESPLGSEDQVEPTNSVNAAYESQFIRDREAGLEMAHNLAPEAEPFRFHCVLNASTAMIAQADEVPVSYLNKGQLYTMTVTDTEARSNYSPGRKYRTYVRVTFQDEEQRRNPNESWNMWTAGRGKTEAPRRGGRLQAVEYVEAPALAKGDRKAEERARIEHEHNWLDGFSVVWTPGAYSSFCDINIRFNFLSTDFSHSKGVKGIPMRLCAKTSVISASEPPAELCYCMIKLFRDHGAERKLAHDIDHVNKAIGKAKLQMAQAESGVKDHGKRKRGGGQVKMEPQRPGKAPKHKRTWSMDSRESSDRDKARLSPEAELQLKLQGLDAMFRSMQPTSTLYLRGSDLDDPELNPLTLPGQSVDAVGPPIPSRSTSVMSLHTQSGVAGPHSVPDQVVEIPQFDGEGNRTGAIEAVGVDPLYKPPTEVPPKPVACFYVALKGDSSAGERVLHRAVYLMERTLANFISSIAAKFQIESANVTRAVHLLQSGLEVEMDDDVIQCLSEGQPMFLEISATEIKGEWTTMSVEGPEGDGANQAKIHYELRCIF
ncbi:CP2 transcription factor-domain-containing protein [Xylariaceae sp. FL0594]|nr:CP2 transcription factor-domain-containing protein [Xylariaceae sp. FL0594]